MRKILFVIIFLHIVLFINAQNRVRNYEEQISFIFNLSNKFTVYEMGTIYYSEHSYKMYKITYNQSNANNKKFLIVSGIHGNEEAPVYALRDVILTLDSQENALKNITVDFIYILNPYGFEHDSRYNGNGLNLSLDFIRVESNEIQMLLNSIKDTQYTGVYDFHEHGNSKSFFLYYYTRKNKQLAIEITEMIKENNFTLENEFVDVILKARDGLIYIPLYAKWYYEYILRAATTGIYFEKRNVKEVFVFEIPKLEDFLNRKTMAKILANYLLQEDRETIVEKNRVHINIIYIGIIIISIICIGIIIKRKIGKRTNGA
ncbi:MAG: DUF2817 domain-containing protein [Treponema sp.]|jgi:hypothetical protein|nr:DUF2817 domain-containing protein [Treponema sp.]